MPPAWGQSLAPITVAAAAEPESDIRLSASQGEALPQLEHARALPRPAQMLEYIPGMVVTQHSGEGKANQYFLRGMNLDHGTDFATTVNGVPVNLPTHAHGQGYTDLNFLIPELVSRVDYRKGPYFASEGDFSSAGSAHFAYRTHLDHPLATLTLGQGGHRRVLVADSRPLAGDVTLLTALEQLNHNGPWTVPEGLRKTNAQFILSSGSPREGWSTSLSAYEARWTATDQIPQRLLDAGTFQGRPFGRFDSLDPTDGGATHRTSVSGTWHRASGQGMTRVSWYALRYGFQLYSNFTYNLDRAQDQFGQSDQRTVLGGKIDRSWLSDLGDGRIAQHTWGLSLRQDQIRVGLEDTLARQTQATVRLDDVRQTSLGLYAESDIRWAPWWRTVAGLRADRLEARVHSLAQPLNSGATGAFRLSPKLSLILGPWHRATVFINLGRGFHSNDARGTTAQVDPRSGQAVSAVPGLVGSRGQEIGLTAQPTPTWQTSWALWRLDLGSELLYVGDAGTTEPGRPSRRTGLEWSNRWTAAPGLVLEADLAWSRPRYTDQAAEGNRIANAVQRVAHVSLSWAQMGLWSGSLALRHIGAAPLNSDNSIRSAASTTAQLRLHRQVTPQLAWALDVLNLTNRRANDISYAYTSRLPDEPAAGVNGLHVHPTEPRTVRLTLTQQF